MFIKPGQSEGACTPVGPDCGGALLQLDPPVASSHWILVRGQVVLPQQPAVRSGWWPLRQSPVTRIGGGDLTLTLRLPEDDEPRPLQLAIDGSFEARLAAYLPRLRDSRRLVRFSLNYRNSHIEQSVPLFMPKPHAGLAIVVLLPALSVRQGLDPDGKQVPMLSEVSRDLTTVLHGGEMDLNPVFYLGASNPHRALAGGSRTKELTEGLWVPVAGQTVSAIAMAEASWVGRLLELYAGELELVVITDTDRQTVAALRALTRLGACLRGIRAVFMSDTRPVARGVMLQAQRPTGIDDLELPIAVCRTLDEARNAVSGCGLVPGKTTSRIASEVPVRRLATTHTRVTRYPLVFCHGMLGYSVVKLKSIDLSDYFHGLRELLTERGFSVLMPELGKTHSIERRAEQLRQTIGRWTTEPVNIIAHSMGGLDARFLISQLGMANRVVSLTTIATPHRGSYFADWFVERFDRKLPFLRSLERVGLEVEGFRDCTRSACRTFNERVPNVAGVHYLSYSAFQVPRKIPPVLRRSHSLIARMEGPNDGLVSEQSARWGEHLATLRADHSSLVGDRGPEFFDHLAFYTRIVDDLVRMGC